MSTNSRTDHFFIYPKDKQGRHLGVTICVLLRNGRMYHGEALCSENDQFNKNVGRNLAFGRAYHEYQRDTDFKSANSEEIDRFIEDNVTDKVEPLEELQTAVKETKELLDDYNPKDEWEDDPSWGSSEMISSNWLLDYGNGTKLLYKVDKYTTDKQHVWKANAHEDDSGWSLSARGKPLMELTDRGSGVAVNLMNKGFNLSYGDFEDIALLFKIWKTDLSQKSKFKRLK